MAGTRKQTKGRRQKRSCGHRGYGLCCHRCEQANELVTRANELHAALEAKTKKFPDFVEIQKAEKATETTPETQPGVLVRGGGQRVFIVTNNRPQEAALSQAVTVMREHAERLKKS